MHHWAGGGAPSNVVHSVRVQGQSIQGPVQGMIWEIRARIEHPERRDVKRKGSSANESHLAPLTTTTTTLLAWRITRQ